MAATEAPALSEDVSGGLWTAQIDEGDTTTLALGGEWDLAYRDAGREALARALERCPERLVIELSHLSFIDARAVHGLLEAEKRCAAQRTRLEIIPGPQPVQRAFQLFGLSQTLSLAALPGASQRPISAHHT